MVNKLKNLRSTGAEEGFTLIELMIVVVIIGILAAIAIPIFANQQKAAITAGVKSDVKNLNTNIVTALVKIPTAGLVCGNLSESSPAISVQKVAGVGENIIVRLGLSDPETQIAVTNQAIAGGTISDFADCGTWNDYAITGFNPNSDYPTLDKGWSYSSKTGKSKQLV